MTRPSADSSPTRGEAEPPTPQVGRFSRYLGGRLVMVGLVSGALGIILLAFAGVKAWRAISGGRLGEDVVSTLVAAVLGVALLSIGQSARRSGVRYLSGHRSVTRDVGRFVATRRSRRRPKH